jgi:hypothetical protein
MIISNVDFLTNGDLIGLRRKSELNKVSNFHEKIVIILHYHTYVLLMFVKNKTNRKTFVRRQNLCGTRESEMIYAGIRYLYTFGHSEPDPDLSKMYNCTVHTVIG